MSEGTRAERIEIVKQYSPMRAKMARIKTLDYVVGDYLVRMYGETEKRIERRDDLLNTPKIWQVVDVDEHGIPCLQFVKLKGQQGQITYLGDEEESYCTFELDPEYMDYVLMGCPEDYDPLGLYKKKYAEFRKLKAKNKKLALKTIDVDLIQDFFKNLSPGDKFYMNRTIGTGITKNDNKYEFIGFEEVHSRGWSRSKSPGVAIRGHYGSVHELDFKDLTKYYLFKTKPIDMSYDVL